MSYGGKTQGDILYLHLPNQNEFLQQHEEREVSRARGICLFTQLPDPILIRHGQSEFLLLFPLLLRDPANEVLVSDVMDAGVAFNGAIVAVVIQMASQLLFCGSPIEFLIKSE